MSIICSCSVKTEINIGLEEPTFHSIFFGIFEDSTFGVVKCYKLVFNLFKKDNIGFWRFFFYYIAYYIYYKLCNIQR